MIFRFLARNLTVANKCAFTPSITRPTASRAMMLSVTSFGFSNKGAKGMHAGESNVSSSPVQDKPATVKKSLQEKKKDEKIEIKTEEQLKELIEKADKSKQLVKIFQAIVSSHNTYPSTIIDSLFLKLLGLQTFSPHQVVDMLTNHPNFHYTPCPQITHLIGSDKVLRLLLADPELHLSPEIMQGLLQQIRTQQIRQSQFTCIVQLLVVRLNRQKLEQVTSADLLAAFTDSLEYRISNQIYDVSKKHQEIADWITEVKKTLPNTQEAHFSVAVFSLSFGLTDVFGEHLLQLSDQEKIIKTLLYLEQCPEDYRFSTVAHLRKLNLSEDLRARLAEFTHSTTDPTQVETE